MSSMDNIAELMTRMGKAAVAAASSLANVSPRVKDQALTGAAAAIRSRRGEILERGDALSSEPLECRPRIDWTQHERAAGAG